MLKQIKYITFGLFFLCFTLSGAQAYTLSTGAEVDAQNLPAPHNKGNGASAEKWCKEAGKRLPTLEELQEMYEKRDIIGGFTDGFDPGGWPYWSERATDNPNGQDFGNRIIFGNGAEDYVEVEDGKMVRKFGKQGEVQYCPFWTRSGYGAYVRCVSGQPCDSCMEWINARTKIKK